jgi:hypothetical protein
MIERAQMMRSNLRYARIAILTMLLAPALVRSAESDLLLTITGPSSIQAGSELKITVELRNTSSHPLSLTNSGAEGPGQEGLYLDVRDGRGSIPPLTEHYRRSQKEGEDGSFFMFTVPPNGRNKAMVVVDHLYQLSTPGKYTIRAERTIGGNTVSSNAITVTVK